MNRRLQLQLRTPPRLLCDRPVHAITAEDQSGWFGILPGRTDLIARLPPGLLTFRDSEGETFVALSGGLLELRDGCCRVLVQNAELSRSLDEVAGALEAALRRRRERSQRQLGVLAELEREALRRLAASTEP